MDEKLYAQDLVECQNVFCANRDDPAPLFTADALMNGDIKKIHLEDYRGQWMILFFYPSDFTFV